MSFIPYILIDERIEEMNFETLYDRLINGEEKLALIGLGYVGMPIAVEFAKHVKVIGFNHNERRIQQYKSGIDPTHEVGDEAISKTTVVSPARCKKHRKINVQKPFHGIISAREINVLSEKPCTCRRPENVQTAH